MKNHGNTNPTWLESLNLQAVPAWTWRLGLIILALSWMLLMASSWSQAEAAQPSDRFGATTADPSRLAESPDRTLLAPPAKNAEAVAVPAPIAAEVEDKAGAEPTDHAPLKTSTRNPASNNSGNSGDEGYAPPVSANSSKDDYNFKWLDPEKKIYVLQNRRYTKANHALVSLMAGVSTGSPYESSYSLDGRLAYYFSESWGIEGFYAKINNSQNDNYKALASTNPGGGANVFPIIRQITDQEGLLLHWVPWYAKINVFNDIIYFDWYFTAGVGSIHSNVTTTYQANSPTQSLSNTGYFFGTGHEYSITQNFIARLDFTGSLYRSQLTLSGDQSWFPNYNFEIGLGLRL